MAKRRPNIRRSCPSHRGARLSPVIQSGRVQSCLGRGDAGDRGRPGRGNYSCSGEVVGKCVCIIPGTTFLCDDEEYKGCCEHMREP